MGGVTDNKGNEALLHKRMTSKFPLYIIPLELTELCIRRTLGLTSNGKSVNKTSLQMC